ncbi:hypothetical protein L7F22_022905 [Adiantum nelumboides]|nr:hypothetical protein [Adiantum nelumboides]
MSEDMVKDGYKDIVNIDISPIVIEAMQKKYYTMPQLQYLTMDVLDMSFFEDCSFDAVIDKGTLDSIMCGMGAPCNAEIMLTEISRVLKPGGVYILITYGDPRLRMPHINRKVFGWSISLFIIRKSSHQTYKIFHPRMPNVQQRFEAENGAENQQEGAENQPNEVAIDAPQVEEQEDAQNQPFNVMQPAEQPVDFEDMQAENPPAMDHWVCRS